MARLQIIVEAILGYNPIKIFLLLASPQFLLGLPLVGFGFLLALRPARSRRGTI